MRYFKAFLFGSLSVASVSLFGCLPGLTNSNTNATDAAVNDSANVSTNSNKTVTNPTPSTNQKLTSDFEPPTGSVTGPANSGPWNSRLMIATSTDGLHFERTNEVVTDQADVPDLILGPDGTLYLYYTGWTVGNKKNATVVAISTDQGESWVYKYVELEGFENMAAPVDPDIQILDDGTFRLYITSDENQGAGPGTNYAEGTDGIHFTRKGVAFNPTDSNAPVLDPSSILIGDTWHLFNGGSKPGTNWHSTSSNGTSFTLVGEQAFTLDGEGYMMANGVAINGGGRMYAFSNKVGDIRSFTSTDGTTWTADEGVRLELDESSGLESQHVKDPGVVQLSDGTYLMVYSTQIPD